MGEECHWRAAFKLSGNENTVEFANGERYEGAMVDGEAQGKGTYFYKNGDKYIGDFVKNQRTGEGVYLWIFGQKFEGTFLDGDMKQGKMFYIDGKTAEGNFKNQKI